MNQSSPSESHVELLEEKHQNTIKNIRELQEMEKYMYENLERISNNGGSVGEEDQIISRINEISQMRLNLFGQLNNQYNTATKDLNDSRHALRDQLTTIGVVEEELKNVKKKYGALMRNKNSKIRMVEIGNYQTQRYNAHIGLMKILSFTALIVIVLSALYHRDIIPGNIVSIAIVIALSTGIILFVRKVIDLTSRSNLVYDQYNWGTDHQELQPGYQGILEHDKLFFEKIGSSVEGDVKKGASSLQHAASTAETTISHTLNKPTQAAPTQSTTIEGYSTYH